MDNIRENKILSILKEEKFLTISEIAKAINYSSSTVRRDLNKLENKNLIKRTQGGALFLEPHEVEMPTDFKQKIHWRQKKYISRLAMDYIKDNQVIFLDGSSTSNALARYLKSFESLKIVTTNMSTAIFLNLYTKNKVYATGGLMRDVLTSSVLTLHMVNKFNFDLSFISCRGIDPRFGITDRVEIEAEIKQIIAKRSKRLVLLVDNSKFNLSFPYVDCDASELSAIVTNKKPEPKYLEMFNENEFELYY